jgi:iduronate 2-sulfatase
MKRLLTLLCLLGLLQPLSATQPNVVLIVCDDLNDFITDMDGHPQALTPNLRRLAESGVSFRHAYANNPVCAPSRSSFLTGIYPHDSKNFSFDKWYQNPVLENSKTLMEHFSDNGYYVTGSGKLMHHHLRKTWQHFEHQADYGPMAFDGEKPVVHPSVPAPFNTLGKVIGTYAPLSDVPFKDSDNPDAGWVYTVKPETGWKPTYKKLRYSSETDRDPTPDERNALWAAEQITQLTEQADDQPFFLAVGFIRPHTPLVAPKEFFDLFPLDTVKIPTIQPNDLSDTHYVQALSRKKPNGKFEERKGFKHFRLLKESYPSPEEGLKAFTQAYLACIAAADANIGRVIDAVDNSPERDNTIIVFVSDHGWHMGEKDFIAKSTLWEESTRIPFIVRAPGVSAAGQIAEQPISLIDLYPTLIDLCSLQGDTRKNSKGAALGGHSIRPFLQDPKNGTWDGSDAAISVIYAGADSNNKPERQHWSVRTERWRYIHYNNGQEELYDHDIDTNEWKNLADNPEFKQVKKELQARLPSAAGI